jgi:8-oxo-dGTP diphosphatase
MWDSGPGFNGRPPLANMPPAAGKDPHESPRATPAARVQKSEFLKPGGRVVDVCAGKPCHRHDYAPSASARDGHVPVGRSFIAAIRPVAARRPTRRFPRVPGVSEQRVEAAGGVVVRDDGRVAVVHRPRYDDWSLPKGKLDAGESFEQAALREVLEETGLVCELGDELPSDQYRDNKGRPKTVRWWRMTLVDDPGFAPNEEVDELRWVTPAEAASLLSYDHDRLLLRDL